MKPQLYAYQMLLGFGLVIGLVPSLSWACHPVDKPTQSESEYTAAQRGHWAYQPLGRSPLPEVRWENWGKNAIDRFIQSGLEELKLSHSGEADRLALLRRVTYDLTGLPPTIEEAERFLQDERPDAYERLVDRLLAGPAYAERWTQHWLDLAHYADSNGFELDADRPDAWRYRDWVLFALNSDLPFTEFVSLQLAGDELHPGDSDAKIATGFGRCGPREVVAGNIDPEVRRQSELTEVTGTVGSVFLGLTLACARCHDHKFDAISARDYYQFQSFFAGAEFVDQPIASAEEVASYKQKQNQLEKELAPLLARKGELEGPFRQRLRAEKESKLTEAERAVLGIPDEERTPLQKKMAAGAEKALNVTWEEVAEAVAQAPEVHSQREKVKQEIFALEQTLPPPPANAMALLTSPEEPPATFLLQRGDIRNKAEQVEPAPLPILKAAQSEVLGAGQGFSLKNSKERRIALSRWLTSAEDNPLLARVIVNRLWQHHFGRGIVATASDFGVRGEAPTHPELLDWLACELRDGGWNLKPLHRLIVTSDTYRQTSASVNQALREADPENQLVGRMARRRLDAEGVRDAMLAVSGRLFLKMGGAGVRPPIEKELKSLIFTEAEVVDLWLETPDPREHHRRSLYLYRKRNVRYPLFDAFDAPDTQSACPKRETSTHAIQPLILLNSEFGISQAKALADRVLSLFESQDERIQGVYRLVLGRGPSPGEATRALRFLRDQAAVVDDPSVANPLPEDAVPAVNSAERAAWVDFCLAMLNRTEFLYVP